MADKLRELLIWRHAKSDWSNEHISDKDRALSERGRRNAKKMASWLETQELLPDVILCSTAKRAQQTLNRLCKDCDIQTLNLDSLYLADLSTLLAELAKVEGKRILLIGHNPGLEKLIDYLHTLPSEQSSQIKLLPTAAIAHFVMPADWSNLERGDGKMVSITRPKDIQNPPSS
ncbi:MAG: histidine phosphatase family protein [Thiomicrospira sp.]|uniref:SixA phosphatase family protein n=1 Tax=Thiomicrospira sp. TaxID=935 RepID=UPI0019FA8D0E|nr:histidine phosphatase family protein [Thiomicrospira sp.]MBE0492775.1 histidine phosphatase family protein [Thiomicrospira sp.]